jgi:alkylation response protein AidB-like acyl-CoA dehydrogenase
MDFSLNEKQKMVQTSLRDLGAKKFLPIADELDRKQEFPMANFKIMTELGLTGLGIPEVYGGCEGDKMTAVIAIEELSRACASTGGILSAHLCLGTEPFYYFGDEQQNQK